MYSLKFAQYSKDKVTRFEVIHRRRVTRYLIHLLRNCLEVCPFGTS